MDQPIHASALPRLRFVQGMPAERPSFTTGLGSFPMKTFLGAALGALLLSTSAMAATTNSRSGPAPESPEGAGIVSTPYAEHTGGQQMPVFLYTAPAGEPADPVVVSTPQLADGSEQESVFNYRFVVPATRSLGLALGRAVPNDTQISVTGNGGR